MNSHTPTHDHGTKEGKRVFACELTVKSYAEEHQHRISLGNKNIFSLRFCQNKNIDFDSGKTSKV